MAMIQPMTRGMKNTRSLGRRRQTSITPTRNNKRFTRLFLYLLFIRSLLQPASASLCGAIRCHAALCFLRYTSSGAPSARISPITAQISSRPCFVRAEKGRSCVPGFTPRPVRRTFSCFCTWLRLNLVQLRGDDDRVVPLIDDPLVHLPVVLRRLVPDINQQKDCFQLLRSVQIALDELSPISPGPPGPPSRSRSPADPPDTWRR